MSRPLVLSLFPGIGLLDMAFEEEGFCVVRGPDLLWGGDIREFHPPAGRFDAVIGGPPCQVHSGMSDLNPLAGRKHGDQIPEFVRCVYEANPDWFVMENVPRAPIPSVPGYTTQNQLFTDSEVGGETTRERRFTFGLKSFTGIYGMETPQNRQFHVETLALHRQDPELTVLAGHGPAAGQRVRGIQSRTWQQCAKLQGLSDEWIARISENQILTVHGYKKIIGNGVPLPMGRAVARAVKSALYSVIRRPVPFAPPICSSSASITTKSWSSRRCTKQGWLRDSLAVSSSIPGEPDQMSESEIKVGRELDALIAEKIFGATDLEVGSIVDPGHHITASEHYGVFGSEWKVLPRYSTRIEDAWKVVERVQQKHPGWRFSLLGGDEQWGYRKTDDFNWGEGAFEVDRSVRHVFGWHARFFGEEDPTIETPFGSHGEATAETPSLAICRAALSSVSTDTADETEQND